MRVVLSVFAPALVAIAVRIILFLIAFIIGAIGVYIFGSEAIGDFAYGFGMFNTFVWAKSYGYWIIVIILSFFAEMAIWS